MNRAKLFGRCEKKSGIAPTDRPMAEVLPVRVQLSTTNVAPRLLSWRCQRSLVEVETFSHIVGILISRVQWLQPKRFLAELH